MSGYICDVYCIQSDVVLLTNGYSRDVQYIQSVEVCLMSGYINDVYCILEFNGDVIATELHHRVYIPVC